MFFRKKIVKGTPLVQLVESYRNAEGQPRQRIVASLGDALIPAAERKTIARAVELCLHGEDQLFPIELSSEGADWVTRIVQLAGRSGSFSTKTDTRTANGVLIDRIETENVVQLGPQLVALKAWNELGLSAVLKNAGVPEGSISIAQLMVANRLIEPLSEWALVDWSHRTALPELLDIRVTKTGKDRLYRTSDQLLSHRIRIEKALRSHEQDLFSLRRSIVLYDVTNTHFEGICGANLKARHGKNKQKRNDCYQVAVGMAFDEHGFALAHEVFEGNMADTSTLGIMLDRLDLTEYGLRPVVILDAGFASEKNVQMLEARGWSYIINITRGSRTKYAEFFENEIFTPLPGRLPKKTVEVKSIVDPDNESRRLVLCRSVQRRAKEQAMISKAEERFLADAKTLKTRIEKGQIKQPTVIHRKIGAFLQKHPRVARFYRIEYEKQTLTIIRKDEKLDEVLRLCGDYILKKDRAIEAAELWELYMTLLRAESGFRMLKGSLGLRPNFHQIEGRVEGHIFISVLAYHLLSWIRHRLELAGDTREWKTIRRLLSTHSLLTTRLPLSDGRTIMIRKPSLPDPEQTHLYTLLGIDWRNTCPTHKKEIFS